MFWSELLLLISIFSLCIFLAYEDLRSAFVFLLLVSPLLHKEVFSLVRWDLLPVRVVMLSLIVTCIYRFLIWFKKSKDFSLVKTYLRDPLLILLISLFVIRVVSLVNSKNIKASLLLLSFYLTVVFLYVLISYLGKRYGERFVLISIKFYSLIAFLTSVIALMQFVLDRKYGIIFGALWRIPGKLPRVGSVFWDVNHYAGYLSSLIPITLGLFFVAKTRFSKIFYLTSSLFMTVILYLTNSRSAWIGFFVSLTIIFINFFYFKYGGKRLILILILALTLLVPFVKEYQNRDSALREKINSYFQYRGDSFASHFLLLSGSYNIFERYPFIGGGYGSFFEHFSKSSVAATYYSRDPAALSVRVNPHSIWGEVLAETGFIGFVIFSLLFVLLAITPFYASSLVPDLGQKRLLISIGSSIVGLFVSGIFYSYNSEFFWIILFLSFVYVKLALSENFEINKIGNYILNKNLYFMILIFILSFFLIFLSLGKNHLIPWDEAIYAKIGKNMVLSHDYLIERWDSNKAWYEKPPLYMWASAFFMNILGFNSWSAKLPSAISGFLLAILVYFLGSKMFGRLTGFISSIILLTTTQFLYYSRVGMLDVLAALFIFLSLYSYFLSIKSSRKTLLWAIAGAFGGLAVMTKGVVGLLVLPLIFFSEAYVFYVKEGHAYKLSQKIKEYLVFIFSMLLIFLPWHIYMYALYGKSFLNTYVGYHVIKRAAESVEGKGQPFYWYLIVLKVSMRIWFIALIGAFLSFIRLLFKERRNFNLSLLFIWAFTIFVFFSLSVSKLVWYIIPLYPVASILAANFIVEAFEFILKKLNVKTEPTYKLLLSFFVLSFGLFYLFFVKNLVFVDDLTGDAANLIMKKDSVIGTYVPLYYDRIEKPLPLFYSNGPVIAVDYTPLINLISDAKFSETIVYITKEGRYQKLSKLFTDTILIERRGDFVLARVPSEKELLEVKISSLESDIFWIEQGVISRDPLAISKSSDLPKLKAELTSLNSTYDEKLKEDRP